MEEIKVRNFEGIERLEEAKLNSGQFGVDALVGLAVSLVVIAIVVGFGIVMLNDMGTKVNDTDAQTAINKGQEGITTITDYLGLIALAIVISIIISIIIVYLYRKFSD